MAVVLLWRVAVTAGASGAAVRSFFSESGQPGWGSAIEWWLRGRLTHDYSDAEAQEALEAHTGYAWSVATYSGSFELRKVHVIWSALDAAVATDDSRIATFHLAKIASGSVVDTWDSTDFTLVNTKFSAWWTAMQGFYTANTVLDRIKVYKDGPEVPTSGNVPVYDADLNIAGTATGNQLPPQVAVTCTEKAGSKLHWGRFYMPAPYISASGVYGRIASSYSSSLADATDTLYQDLKAGALHPVVYRAALPARTKKNGAALAARDAEAWDVTDIQVDDVFDVIRSRRWKYPLVRTQRAIA